MDVDILDDRFHRKVIQMHRRPACWVAQSMKSKNVESSFVSPQKSSLVEIESYAEDAAIAWYVVVTMKIIKRIITSRIRAQNGLSVRTDAQTLAWLPLVWFRNAHNCKLWSGIATMFISEPNHATNRELI